MGAVLTLCTDREKEEVAQDVRPQEAPATVDDHALARAMQAQEYRAAAVAADQRGPPPRHWPGTPPQPGQAAAVRGSVGGSSLLAQRSLGSLPPVAEHDGPDASEGSDDAASESGDMLDVGTCIEHVLVAFEDAQQGQEWVDLNADAHRIRSIGSGLAMDERVLQGARFDAMMTRECGLSVRPVQADGNCLFRAVAFLMFGNEERHAELRASCCDELQHGLHAQLYRDVLAEEYEAHVRNMRELGEWGTELEIRALENLLRRQIVIYDASSPVPKPMKTHYTEITADTELTAGAPLRLSYHHRTHYNALVPAAPRLTSP